MILRGDHNGMFSRPIKEALDALGIGYSDPEVVERMLAEPANRRLLETFRLLVNRRDSLAWAGLLLLTPGTGASLSDYIYERARADHTQFGQALFAAYDAQFPDGPRSATKAAELIRSVTAWLDAHPLPADRPAEGWGHWMVENAGGNVVPEASAEFMALLCAIDDLAETDEEFGRYLSQITPLGRDRALAESQGVRIMTMNGAKGLTVRAAIVVGLEEGIVPRPDGDLGEERRLLYVAMTRAKEYLFGTWARRRRGPTARAGAPRVHMRRRHCSFLDGGPVQSQDGPAYLHAR